MMLTGTMAQRNVLRDKILARPGITDARIIRADLITSVFGPGYDHQAPADELDRRALAGEEIIEVSDEGRGRVLVNRFMHQKTTGVLIVWVVIRWRQTL